ncbi:MAG: EAL domain-containing protein [Hyphomicrobium sp.]|uniref:EAL domain-containing protein n=1 Tax=Hyphomicrobium sp. TaxID=82 RepID=UPI003D12984F
MTSQTVTVVAMGLVATAAAVALNQHGGMPAPVAATAALAAYLLLLTIHALVWRRAGAAPARARNARIAGMLRPERSDQRNDQRNTQRAAPPVPAPALQAGILRRGTALQQAPMPSPEIVARAPQLPQPASGPHTPPPIPPAMPNPAPRAAEQRPAPPPLPQTRPASPPAAALPPGADDLQDFWSFRPAAQTQPVNTSHAANTGQKLPPFVAGRATARAAEPTLPGPTLPGSSLPSPTLPDPALSQPKATSPREADVEVIQDAIKRLLEEVNAAEQSRGQAVAGAVPPPLPPQGAISGAPDTSIERSIEALRMAAGTMRTATGQPPVPVAPTAPAPQADAAPHQPSPPPLPPFVRGAAPQHRAASPAGARARLMADAISAGRIDVSLEPILGLEDQQTRHYEVSIRLRDADGNPLDITPDGPDLRGTGLLPLFDGVRVTRTAAVARRLEDRGKAGSVFSAFSGESVADEHFLGELAETLHLRASLASQLVLSFSQTDVRGFSTPEWDSLADMRALGFRFALSAVTDLDLDFEALAEQGFVFVKLDASVFLEGLPAPSGRISSADVCRHLAQHGMTLVVDHIDDDDKLARVFGFGVLLGQGQLFGGPRPVRAEVANDRARGTTVAA